MKINPWVSRVHGYTMGTPLTPMAHKDTKCHI